MERLIGLAGVFLAALVGVLALLGWHVIDRVGAGRVYSDLATWALLLTLIVGGIVFLRVLLTGLAKLAIGRNAHKAQPVERHTIERERHTIDGRPAAPQILTMDRPADLRQIYPDMARAAIEWATPAQIAAPEVYEVEPETADIWAQLDALFVD
ncbi:hypothetical protein [Ottowia sp.]|uniref:hypothetical protein n=1 Tax=Ottowia sp. TaxID=1898956 RepID=UPI002BC1E9AA|nr:hypothetical protein [Ottowia sp.]HNR84716.1 hypothetical protein [Ottowia sp.]